MTDEIYACCHCFGPMWFPYGDKMHIGTGWYCWKSQQAAEEPSGASELPSHVPRKTIGTKPDLRKRLVAQLVRLYLAWLRRPDRVRLLSFLQKQLVAERADVVQDFLRYLARRHDDALGQFVRQLIATAEWRRFARHCLRVYSPKTA